MGTTYYLDNSTASASDHNAGTSADAPFKSLAALNRSFAAGDTVAIKAGTTYSGTLAIMADGNAAAPVTFTKYGEGVDPLIDAGNRTHGIHMQGANHVVVDDIAVTNSARVGVEVDEASSGNTFTDMEVMNAGFGYYVAGNGNLFTRNFVHDLQMVNNTPGGDDDYGAIAFAVEGDNNEFTFNRVERAKAHSYDYGIDGGGFETWRSVAGLKIRENWVRDSAGFFEAGGVAGDVLTGVEISSNVSWNNGGFQFLHNAVGKTNFGMTISGVNVHHNIIIEPSAWTILGFSGPVGEGSYSFTDNIVYAPNAGQVFNQPGSYHMSNFYVTAATPTGTNEAGGRIGLTNFAGDLHLLSGSPAAASSVYALIELVSPNAPTSQVARLYDTVFDRAADLDGLVLWTAALQSGASLDTLADAFVTSPEFQARYGSVRDNVFVDLLYRNGLNRGSDVAEQEFWAGGLGRSVWDRGDVTAFLSESPEHLAKLTLPSIDPLA